MGPEGSSGDYDFFGATARPVPNAQNPAAPAPAAAPAGAPDRFGGAPGQFGAPVGQFGQPAGQFGAPAGQFGAPAGQFGAPPAQDGQPGAFAQPAYRPGRKKGMPVWAAVLLGVGAFIVIGIACAIMLPIILGSDVQKAWKATTVSMPSAAAGYTRMDTPAAQRLADQASKDLADEDIPDVKAGIYMNGSNSVVALAGKYSKPNGGGAAKAQEEFMNGLKQANIGDVGSLVPVPPGELGGSVFCARTVGDKQYLACGSTDVAAEMLLIFDDPTTSNATVIAMREAIEKRA